MKQHQFISTVLLIPVCSPSRRFTTSRIRRTLVCWRISRFSHPLLKVGRTTWTGVSSLQVLYLQSTAQHTKVRAYSHVSSGFWTHNFSVRAVRTRDLRPRRHCDRIIFAHISYWRSVGTASRNPTSRIYIVHTLATHVERTYIYRMKILWCAVVSDFTRNFRFSMSPLAANSS